MKNNLRIQPQKTYKLCRACKHFNHNMKKNLFNLQNLRHRFYYKDHLPKRDFPNLQYE